MYFHGKYVWEQSSSNFFSIIRMVVSQEINSNDSKCE
jgi:hypothetical protein